MRPLVSSLVFVAAAAPALLAQQTIRDSAPVAPTAVPAGTGTLSGQVVTFDEPPRAVGRAIVTVSGDQTRARSVIANDDGTFLVDGLPDGRFTVKATRPGFVEGTFGARQPLRSGTPVTIAGGERRDGLTIRLARGAVITGTVRDEFGQPVAGLGVTVSRLADLAATMARLNSGVNATGDTTDDRGVYRVFGLAPGTYNVVVGSRGFGQNDVQARSAEEIDAIFAELRRGPNRSIETARAGSTQQSQLPGRRPSAPDLPKTTVAFAPVFYPGTPIAADAGSITVSAGEERAGADLVFAPTRTARISGTIVNPGGPLPTIQLSLAAATGTPTMPASLLKSPGQDGAFVYTSVPPGRYEIMVRAGTTTAPPPGTSIGGPPTMVAANSLAGVVEITVAGVDIDNVVIVLQPAPHVTGRVLFDAATLAPPSDLSRIRVSIQAPNQGGTMMLNGVMTGRIAIAPATVKPDGTFDVAGAMSGSYQVTVGPSPGPPWWLRSVMLGNRDLLDVPLDIGATDVTGLTATFTDRHTELNGRLVTPAGAPATDYVVIVFAADRAFWRPQGRRLASARPATDGQFVVKDLPAGDYFIAALTVLDPDTWQAAAFLDQVLPAAIKVTIGDGEKKTQDLRIAR